MNSKEPKEIKEDVEPESSENTAEKLKFGSLSPLTASQIVTLLVGASSSNTSYGGY